MAIIFDKIFSSILGSASEVLAQNISAVSHWVDRSGHKGRGTKKAGALTLLESRLQRMKKEALSVLADKQQETFCPQTPLLYAGFVFQHVNSLVYIVFNSYSQSFMLIAYYLLLSSL